MSYPGPGGGRPVVSPKTFVLSIYASAPLLVALVLASGGQSLLWYLLAVVVALPSIPLFRAAVRNAQAEAFGSDAAAGSGPGPESEDKSVQ